MPPRKPTASNCCSSGGAEGDHDEDCEPSMRLWSICWSVVKRVGLVTGKSLWRGMLEQHTAGWKSNSRGQYQVQVGASREADNRCAGRLSMLSRSGVSW